MRRKAILLTLRPENGEMEELVFALGAELVGTVFQRRLQPDPQSFLGSGKLEEARETRRALGAGLVVVNAALKPGQIFGIQRFFNEGNRDGESAEVEVYDRTRLILEIFRERARSPEARLQVELAQLTYDMPLVKEAINLAKKGERQAAMFGGGATGVNELHDQMKKRMARIRRDLDKMRGERALRRKHRRRSGFHLVSLAGYTNAGKSSLLKALSDRDTLSENRYFSTLSTKTARAQSERREILVTDTVGFIEDLPPWMVEAFHSTLEEIALADVILLVVDASDPVGEISRRLRSSYRVLWEFDGRPESAAGHDAGGGGDASGAAAPASRAGGLLVPMRRGLAPILVALNKIDRISEEELKEKRAALEAEGILDPAMTVAVSARSRTGLDDLYQMLYTLIPDYDEYEMALPSTSEAEALVSWIHEVGDVLDLTRGNEVHLHFEAKRSLRSTLLARLAAVGATPLREVQRDEPDDRVADNPGLREALAARGTDADPDPGATDAEPAEAETTTAPGAKAPDASTT